ncbi:hypothetical protein HRbin14_01756 [bacterium HR14]|nr:hypothetical protein HRbin14_01756 [bacterium HR14]
MRRAQFAQHHHHHRREVAIGLGIGQIGAILLTHRLPVHAVKVGVIEGLIQHAPGSFVNVGAFHRLIDSDAHLGSGCLRCAPRSGYPLNPSPTEEIERLAVLAPADCGRGDAARRQATLVRTVPLNHIQIRLTLICRTERDLLAIGRNHCLLHACGVARHQPNAQVNVFKVNLHAGFVLFLLWLFGRIVAFVFLVISVGTGLLVILASQIEMADVQRIGFTLREEHQHAPIPRPRGCIVVARVSAHIHRRATLYGDDVNIRVVVFVIHIKRQPLAIGRPHESAQVPRLHQRALLACFQMAHYQIPVPALEGEPLAVRRDLRAGFAFGRLGQALGLEACRAAQARLVLVFRGDAEQVKLPVHLPREVEALAVLAPAQPCLLHHRVGEVLRGAALREACRKDFTTHDEGDFLAFGRNLKLRNIP